MSNPLDADTIKQLLLEQASSSSGRGGGRGRTKADPTDDRTVNGWFKLSHHLCTSDCEHRFYEINPTYNTETGKRGNSCWNPNCLDPRDKSSDRATQIVAQVKGQFICRYCYLDGYLFQGLS